MNREIECFCLLQVNVLKKKEMSFHTSLLICTMEISRSNCPSPNLSKFKTLKLMSKGKDEFTKKKSQILD